MHYRLLGALRDSPSCRRQPTARGRTTCTSSRSSRTARSSRPSRPVPGSSAEPGSNLPGVSGDPRDTATVTAGCCSPSTTTHRPATDLGLPAAQAPGAGAGVLAAASATAHVLLPRGERGALHGGAAARHRPGRTRPARARSALRAGRVRQRPALRRVVVPVGGARERLQDRDGRACKGRESSRRRRSPLEASLPAVPARGGELLVRRLFEPLGYEVEVDADRLDPVPDWGDVGTSACGWRRPCASPTCSPTSTCCCRCSTTRSTTGSTRPRSRSCCAAASEWLPAHPERELIARRYLKHERRPVLPGARAARRGRRRRSDEPSEERSSERVSLRDQRLGAVAGGPARRRARGACSTSAAAPGALLQPAAARRLRRARRRRRLGAGAGAGRATAEARRMHDASAAHRAAAQPADLPRQAPRRLRRGGAGRGDRAPRPAAPGGAGGRTSSARRGRRRSS